MGEQLSRTTPLQVETAIAVAEDVLGRCVMDKTLKAECQAALSRAFLIADKAKAEGRWAGVVQAKTADGKWVNV